MKKDYVELWRTLFHDSKHDAIEDMLAEDIVLHSPIMHTPQTGKKHVAGYIIGAHHIYNQYNFDYIRDWSKDREIVLEFEGEIDGIVVNGIDIIRWNKDGKIDDFKVMVRPASGVKALGQTMVELMKKSKS